MHVKVLSVSVMVFLLSVGAWGECSPATTKDVQKLGMPGPRAGTTSSSTE
jgi:hypothetical protein